MTRTMRIVAAVAATVLVLGAGLALAAASRRDSSTSSVHPGMSGRMMGGSMMSGGMMGGSMMSGGMMNSDRMGSMMGGSRAGADSAPAAIDGARQVTVVAGDLRFSPSTLTLTAGEAVNVVIRNSDELVHDFTVPALGVHVTVRPGQEVTIGLRPTTAGTYPFVCTVPGHAQAGMGGTIVVES